MVDNYHISERKLDDIFRGTRYVIPEYQQEYSWERENAERLWNDVISADDVNLLGTIVAVAQNSNGERYYDVIDGQQHLVTLTLLLCAVRDYVNKLAKNSTVKNMLLNHINKHIPDTQPRQVTFGGIDNICFEKLQADTKDIKNTRNIKKIIINGQKMPKSQERLLKNYDAFCKQIAELCVDENINFEDNSDAGIRNLWRLLDSMFDKNVFAFVSVHNPDYAYMIFDALNATGMKLTQASMIKTHLAENAKDRNFKIRWDNIIKKFDNSDSFLYDSLLSRHPAAAIRINSTKIMKLNLNNLYEIVTKKYSSADLIDRYLSELDQDKKCVLYLTNPDQGLHDKAYDKDTKLLFDGIAQLNANYIRAPVIAAHRKWGFESDNFKKLTKCLLAFFFRHRTICDGSTDTIKKISRSVTTAINNDMPLNEIIKLILEDRGALKHESLCESDLFVKLFRDEMTNLKESDAVAKYILTSIEEYWRSGDAPLDYDDFEIEHILPKNPSADWNVDVFCKDRMEQYAKPTFEPFTHRLGNLTLVTPKWSKKMKNSDFAHKKYGDQTKNSDIYCLAASDLKLNNEIVSNYDEWTAKTVEDREKQLCDVATRVWSLDNFRKLYE